LDLGLWLLDGFGFFQGLFVHNSDIFGFFDLILDGVLRADFIELILGELFPGLLFSNKLRDLFKFLV